MQETEKEIFFNDYKCPVDNCSIRGSSQKSLQEHCDSNHSTIEDMKGIIEERKKQIPVCIMCATVFYDQHNYEKHLQDNLYHKWKLTVANAASFCTTCFIVTRTPQDAINHENGRKHWTRTKRLEWIKTNYHIPSHHKSARK